MATIVEKREKKGYAKVIFLMIIITILLLIKVYLANETYYISRDIQKIATKIDALKEERNILKLKIEKLEYKSEITDPLFKYDPKQEIQEVKNSSQESNNEETINKLKAKTKPKPAPKPKKHKSTKELFENLNTTEDVFWLKDF